MKKTICSLAIILLLAFLFVPQLSAQDKEVNGFSVVQNLGTAAVGSQKIAYLDLRGWKTVDSVGVSLSASGEIDVDTVNFYPGNYNNKGFRSDAAASVLYQAVTLDLADGVADGNFPLLTSNATKLTGAALRYCNGVEAVIEVQNTNGSDATDTGQNLTICWRIYGTK